MEVIVKDIAIRRDFFGNSLDFYPQMVYTKPTNLLGLQHPDEIPDNLGALIR
jgi:hypothetical protein